MLKNIFVYVIYSAIIFELAISATLKNDNLSGAAVLDTIENLTEITNLDYNGNETSTFESIIKEEILSNLKDIKDGTGVKQPSIDEIKKVTPTNQHDPKPDDSGIKKVPPSIEHDSDPRIDNDSGIKKVTPIIEHESDPRIDDDSVIMHVPPTIEHDEKPRIDDDPGIKTVTPSIDYDVTRSLNRTTVMNVDVPEVIDKPIHATFSGKDQNIWFDHIKLFSIVFARSQLHKNTFCGQDSEKFLNDLAAFKLWAVQMYDASTKIPAGIWDGAIFDFGNFHKCLRINAYENEEAINGKYCLIEMESKLKNSSWLKQDPFTINYDPLESAWEKIHYQGDKRKVRRDTFTLALCLPSSCTEEDIVNGISTDTLPQPDQDNLDISVRISRYGCTVKEEKLPTTGDYIFWAITLFMIILIIISTIWLHNEEKKLECELKITTFWHKVAKSFSIIENFNALTKYKHTKPCFNILHGVKFLCMGLIIHGHRLLHYFGKPLQNNEVVEDTYIYKGYMVIHNGLIVLDAFFLMTGFIMSYSYLESFEKRKTKFLQLPYSILLRFLRLIPAYMYVVFFIATVWARLGSGPLWNTVALIETEKCSQTWWTSLLLINNYVEPENMCMMTTWYLSCDFHMFIIGTVIMFIISKTRKIGYTILGLCTIISLVIPFVIVYKDGTNPLLTIFPGLTDVRENEVFINYYIKTHMRMFPYLFGLIAGIIYYKIRDTKFQMPAILSVIFFALIETVITYVCEISGHDFFHPGIPLDPLKSAIYYVVQHAVFSSFVVLLVFNVSHTKASFFPAVLGNKFFAILSKLTFGAYLLHYLIQTYDNAIQITPISFIFTSWFTNLITDLVLSYALAFVLFLLVESPIKRLTNLIL